MSDTPSLPNISLMGGGRAPRYHLLDETDMHLTLDDHHSSQYTSMLALTAQSLRQQAQLILERDYSRAGLTRAFDTTENFFVGDTSVSRRTSILDCFEEEATETRESPPTPATDVPTIGEVVTAVRSSHAFQTCVDRVSAQNTGLMHTLTSHLAIHDDPQDGYYVVRPISTIQLPSAGTFVATARIGLRFLTSFLRQQHSNLADLTSILSGNEVDIPMPGLAATSAHLVFNDHDAQLTITTRPIALIREWWPSAVSPSLSDHVFSVQVTGSVPTDEHGSPASYGVMALFDIAPLLDSGRR